jgi:hypothetical protein
MTQEELDQILSLHQKWLNNEPDGVRADLVDANLKGVYLDRAYLDGADLARANLQGANIKWANLKGANLEGTDLRGANLRGANLEVANLEWADLVGANLEGANLRGANLKGANLVGVNLEGANLDQAKLPDYQIPQDEVLIVYKKVCYGIVLKLEIPADAKRTASLVGNKCRCDKAKVIGWMDINKDKDFRVEPHTFISKYNDEFEYKMGEYVTEPAYDNDPRLECTQGIHFFMDFRSAKYY